jgi:hypothetical protein
MPHIFRILKRGVACLQWISARSAAFIGRLLEKKIFRSGTTNGGCHHSATTENATKTICSAAF